MMNDSVMREILFWAMVIYGVLSTVVVWSFVTGRWSRSISAQDEAEHAKLLELEKDHARLELLHSDLNRNAIANTERVNSLIGQLSSRMGIIEKDLGHVQEIRADLGRLQMQLVETERRAKHEAVNALSGEISKLQVTKVNEDLHRANMAEIMRRIEWLERVLERGGNRRSQP